MGVQRKIENLQPVRIQDAEEFNYADYDLTESGDESNNVSVDNISRSKKNKEKRNERKLRKMFENVETDGVNVKRNMGSRKHRRLESVRLLLSYTDRDDICTDFSDLVPRTITAFEKLFAEKENMRMWNEFIEKEEQEQRYFLETGKWAMEEDDQLKEFFIVGGKSIPRKKNDDERKHHPAYSARSCFDQIEKKGKKLLTEKHLPWGFVVYIEQQLRDCFSVDSDAVYVGQYESSLHRALLHAVAQFLRLTSKSSSDESTQMRITEVRNNRAYFIPPRMELVPYLSSIRPSPIEYLPWNPESDANSSFEQCSS